MEITIVGNTFEADVDVGVVPVVASRERTVKHYTGSAMRTQNLFDRMYVCYGVSRQLAKISGRNPAHVFPPQGSSFLIMAQFSIALVRLEVVVPDEAPVPRDASQVLSTALLSLPADTTHPRKSTGFFAISGYLLDLGGRGF